MVITKFEAQMLEGSYRNAIAHLEDCIANHIAALGRDNGGFAHILPTDAELHNSIAEMRGEIAERRARIEELRDYHEAAPLSWYEAP